MPQLLQIHEPGATPAPGKSAGPVAVGIDLGTTNSVVAIGEVSGARVLRDEDGSALVPSIVAYAANGSAIVGELARRLMLDRPEVVVEFDQAADGSWRCRPEVSGRHSSLSSSRRRPRKRLRRNGGRMVRVVVAGRTLSPVEISADILRALKERGETQLDRKVDQAVVTVPAYFDDAARTATRDAARLAGLEVLRLVNEPTAAALAYGLDEGAEGIYAIYDLGGGTFDVSLLNMQKGVFQVLGDRRRFSSGRRRFRPCGG